MFYASKIKLLFVSPSFVYHQLQLISQLVEQINEFNVKIFGSYTLKIRSKKFLFYVVIMNLIAHLFLLRI